MIRHPHRAGDDFFWGVTFGALGWLLGPLTLVPLAARGRVAWDVASAQAAFPVLVALVYLGAAGGVVAHLLRGADRSGITVSGLVRGLAAGLIGAWVLGRFLDGQSQWLESSGMVNEVTHRVANMGTTGIALLAGLAFAALYPRSDEGTGPAVVRGALYGLFWWILGALTLLPLWATGHTVWGLAAARDRFPALVAFFLFGIVLAVTYHVLDGAARVLFAEDIGMHDAEGMGARGLRAVVRGAFAGIIGGLVFTVVMLRIGVLPAVARLIGLHSPLAGFLVHMAIADIIGASFGLLFLRRSEDLPSALGWGLSYGFVWWVLGPLTLMPVLLGAPPRWTAEVGGMLMASLVGHLGYGAAVGVVFHRLEERYNPWWLPQTERDERAVARRRQAGLSAAPALWALVVITAVTWPVLLTCGAGTREPAQAPGTPYSMAPPADEYGTPSGECGAP